MQILEQTLGDVPEIECIPANANKNKNTGGGGGDLDLIFGRRSYFHWLYFDYRGRNDSAKSHDETVQRI